MKLGINIISIAKMFLLKKTQTLKIILVYLSQKIDVKIAALSSISKNQVIMIALSSQELLLRTKANLKNLTYQPFSIQVIWRQMVCGTLYPSLF